MDNPWSGLLFLAGAAAGYAVFMGLQPCRGAWVRGYRIARDYPCLWLVAGVFETTRLTIATAKQLATSGISPDDFVRAAPLNLVPYLRELLVPAGDAALVSLLRLATFFVDAWPLSVVLAACLLANAGGALRQLWVSPSKRGRGGGNPFPRWIFTVLAVAAALAHLADAGIRFLPLPDGWIAMVTPLREEILRTGSDLFVTGCGVGVQLWIVLWIARSLGPGFDGVPVPAAIGRVGSLFLVIVAWTGLPGLWRQFDEIGNERIVTAGACLAAFVMLPALVRVMAGECGLIAGLARHGLWVFRHFDRVFWWGTTAAVHLALLHVCGLAMNATIAELPWAVWLWGVFFSFLKAGVYVWLLSFFIVLVEETLVRTPRKNRS